MTARRGHRSGNRRGAPVSGAGPESTVIPAKLEPPRIRRGFIERPSLLVRLDHSLEGRVTLISAPAGYGKSTLVSQWLCGPSAPASAWLSLAHQDSDLERFSKYLVAALRRVQPECLPNTDELLGSQFLPSPEYLAETMVAEISEFRQRVVLVLDDYASIREESVHGLVDSLVQHLPETLHLVVLSRVDPPLPVALWRSRHWLHELRGIDLRFSREEARQFFDAAEDLRLSDEAIDTVHRKTEGWIAGLRLALLSLSGSTDPEEQVRDFSGSDRLIVDYLLAEALGAQPPEVREFLALTAPLERFCAPLCDHIVADRPRAPGYRKMIERLERANVFLVSLGPTGGWYRYHHLFRELVLEHFDELVPPMSREEIFRRAGEWFSREGWLEEGLQYLLAANDLDGAADIVAEHLHDTINRDLSRRTLVRWLGLFPPGAERGRLPLIVASLYVMQLRFDNHAMLEVLDEAEATCGDLASERGRRWWRELQTDLDVLRAYVLYWLGDPAEAHKSAASAMARTIDPRGIQFVLAVQYLGAGLALAGRRGDALRFLDEGVAAARPAGNPHLGLYLIVKAYIHLYWGELGACRGPALEGLTAMKRLGTPRHYHGHADIILGSVAYERNLLDEAEKHFREVEALRFDVHRMIYHEALLGLAQIALARGQHESAEGHLAAAIDSARKSGAPLLYRSLDSFGQRLNLAMGRRPAVPSLAPAGPDFMSLSLYPPTFCWAWLSLHDRSEGALQNTLSVIEEALDRAEAHGVVRRALQLQVLRAAAVERLGRRDEAVAALEGAIERARPLGFIRSFLDCGALLRGVFEEAAAWNPEDPYVRELLGAFDAPAGGADGEPAGPQAASSAGLRPGESERHTSGSRGAPFEDLTNREIDVLMLLQRRLSNKEVASRLGISAATVKTHTLNLYRKLGVHSRRQAVAEAVRLKILAG